MRTTLREASDDLEPSVTSLVRARHGSRAVRSKPHDFQAIISVRRDTTRSDEPRTALTDKARTDYVRKRLQFRSEPQKAERPGK